MREQPARRDRGRIARRRPHRLPVRAVLFDLDGTLADTAADLAAALNRVRADRALPALPLATLRPQASHGARGLLSAGFGIGKEHADFASLRDAFLAYYAEALCEQTTLFPGAEGVVTWRRSGAMFLKAEYMDLKPATPAADRVRMGPAEMALTRMCFSWLPRSTAR